MCTFLTGYKNFNSFAVLFSWESLQRHIVINSFPYHLLHDKLLVFGLFWCFVASFGLLVPANNENFKKSHSFELSIHKLGCMDLLAIFRTLDSMLFWSVKTFQNPRPNRIVWKVNWKSLFHTKRVSFPCKNVSVY